MKTTDQRKVRQRRGLKRFLRKGKYYLLSRSEREEYKQATTVEIQKHYSFNIPVTSPNWFAKNRHQPALFKGQILYLAANDYMVKPEQLWLVESIVGSAAMQKAILGGKILDNVFFNLLFRRSDIGFYLSDDEEWLLGYDDELTQADFGPLTRISLLEAVRRYGLEMVEQAKEKTAVHL